MTKNYFKKINLLNCTQNNSKRFTSRVNTSAEISIPISPLRQTFLLNFARQPRKWRFRARKNLEINVKCTYAHKFQLSQARKILTLENFKSVTRR